MDIFSYTNCHPGVKRSALECELAHVLLGIRGNRRLDRPDPGMERVTRTNEFSPHTGVSCEGHQIDERERFCRYIARPAVFDAPRDASCFKPSLNGFWPTDAGSAFFSVTSPDPHCFSACRGSTQLRL